MSASIRIIVIGMLLATALALGLILFRATAPTQVAVRETGQTPSAPQTQVAPQTMISYLTAAHPLPAGTLARSTDFVEKAVQPSALPPDAIIATPASQASVNGALIKHYVDAGAPIFEEDILRPRDRGFLAAVLEPGMVAVAIGVDPVSGVAGLIWPGDHVDIVLTQDLDGSWAPLARRVVSETALSNVRVIAVDQSIIQGAPVSSDVAGKLASTVTVEVTQQESEKLAVAQRLGHLSLAICAAPAVTSVADANGDVDQSPTVYSSDVSPALAQSGQPAGARMEVIQGDSRNEVTFK